MFGEVLGESGTSCDENCVHGSNYNNILALLLPLSPLPSPLSKRRNLSLRGRGVLKGGPARTTVQSGGD